MKQDFVEDNIMIISKQTLDKFFKEDEPSDLIGLYMFYYYTAKKQQTNIIKCSTDCVVKCLNWAKCKVVRNKKVLIKKGLVNDVRVKNKKGQITGWYIKLDYI